MFANAEAYEQFMGRWSRVVATELVASCSVPDEGQLLDVGSGTGSLSFAIAKLKTRLRVVGVDPSNDYVGHANNRNPVPDRVSFEIGDAQHLRFADATFCGSVSLLVFNFIPDPLKALQEMRRVTEPGGLISAAVWDYAGQMGMLRTFWDAASSIDEKAGKLDEGHMRLCRSGELTQLWKQAGLKNVQEHPLDIEMQFQSFEDYWQPFRLGQGPAGAYAASLDGVALQRLRDELWHRLPQSGEGVPFVLPARAWTVSGTVP
jgi:ubiquinone/menaquinone biosynthesis C-methylase UbiE